MRYSQMEPELRHLVLGNPENYPLRVAFLGKRGLLNFGEVAFLQSHRVDFDVDDQQFSSIVVKYRNTELAIEEEIPKPSAASERPNSGVSDRPWSAVVAILAAIILLLRLMSLITRRRPDLE